MDAPHVKNCAVCNWCAHERSTMAQGWEALPTSVLQHVLELAQVRCEGKGWTGKELQAIARTCPGWARALDRKENTFWKHMCCIRWKELQANHPDTQEDGTSKEGSWCDTFFDMIYGKNFRKERVTAETPTLRDVFGEGRLRISSMKLLDSGCAFASMDGRLRVCHLRKDEGGQLKHLTRETSIMAVLSVDMSHGLENRFLCVVGLAWANDETCKVDVWHIDPNFSALALCMSFHEERRVIAACAHPNPKGGLALVTFLEKHEERYYIKMWAASGLRVRPQPIELKVPHELTCLNVVDGYIHGCKKTLVLAGTSKGILLIWPVLRGEKDRPFLGELVEVPLGKHVSSIREVKATVDTAICLGNGNEGKEVVIVVEFSHKYGASLAAKTLDFSWKTWSANSFIERPITACFVEESVMVVDNQNRMWRFVPGQGKPEHCISRHNNDASIEGGNIEQVSSKDLALMTYSGNDVSVVLLSAN